MTVPDRASNTVRVAWGLACVSAAVSVLLLAVGGPATFRIGATCIAGTAATCMAVVDHRTGLLRNVHTGAFAAGAVLQVLIGCSVSDHPIELLGTTVIAVLVNTGLYAAMGLAGWVGFGDVKFVVGLSLIAALLTGVAAMLLPPVAILLAAVLRAVRAQRGRYPHPHGPVLVLTFVLILTGHMANSD